MDRFYQKELEINSKIVRYQQYISKRQKQFLAAKKYHDMEKDFNKKQQLCNLMDRLYFQIDRAEKDVELLQIDLLLIPTEIQIFEDGQEKKRIIASEIINQNPGKTPDQINFLIKEANLKELNRNIDVIMSFNDSFFN